MPYIPKERRGEIEIPETSGELNFIITKICIAYLNKNGLKYSTINDIIGACEGAKLEFYRRVAAPYENQKIALNGDVY